MTSPGDLGGPGNNPNIPELRLNQLTWRESRRKMFLSCIPRCQSPGPKKPCWGCLAQWWGRWASPHPRRTWSSKQKTAMVSLGAGQVSAGQHTTGNPPAAHRPLGVGAGGKGPLPPQRREAGSPRRRQPEAQSCWLRRDPGTASYLPFSALVSQVQERSASRLAQHRRLRIASRQDVCQAPFTDDLCVVGEWSKEPTAPKPPHRAFPSTQKPPDVPLSRTLVVKAQIEPRGSANAHLGAEQAGPVDFPCGSRDPRSGPGLAPDLTAGAEQSPDLQTTPPLEQCRPSNHQRRHNDARGTAVSPGAEQGSGEAPRGEALGMVGLEPRLHAAAEAEDAAGAPDAALAPASAPAPQGPSASAPGPQCLSLPAPVILYFSSLLPTLLLFSTLLSLNLNKM